jgi:guanine deaminase
MHEPFLRRAVELATNNVRLGRGGPFGAVIVRDGAIVAEGVNTVTPSNDPTAHAEVNAIRIACQTLGRFDLRGCVLYASCEPCPMCLGAIYWARLDALYYAATREDAAAAGFDDSLLYEEIPKLDEARRLMTRRLALAEALLPFEAWTRSGSKIPY